MSAGDKIFSAFLDSSVGLSAHREIATSEQRVINIDMAGLRAMPSLARVEPLTRRDRNRMSLAEFGGAYQYHYTRTRVGLEQSYPFLPESVRNAYSFYTMRDMVRKFRRGGDLEPYSVPRRVGEALIGLYETIPGRLEPVKASEVDDVKSLPLARAFRMSAAVVAAQMHGVMQRRGLVFIDVVQMAMPATGLSRSTISHALYRAGETYPRLNAAMILAAIEGQRIPPETLAWNSARVRDLISSRRLG